MQKNFFAALLFFAWAMFFPSQTRSAQAQSESRCETYLQTPLPAEASQVAAHKAWPDCNSYKLEAGLGVKVDYAAARQCAWAERLAVKAGLEPKYTVAGILGGSAMLSVLYANGEGVEQNIPLAGRFACEAGIGERGIEDLEKLSSAAGKAQKKFTYCDEAFTTFQMNYCAAYNVEIAAQRRDNLLKHLFSRWPGDQQAAFKLLQQAEEEYVKAHGRGETDMGGTIRVIREFGVEERQRDKFLAAVQEFESGHLPQGTAADCKKADADLNLLYRKAVAAAAAHKEDYFGAIKPEGIQNAESAWLKYRDAWIAFARLRYPSTDANAWLTLLTVNRAASLRMTLCGIDDKNSSCPQK
jgi:uncharacterized protein YecT (DUF1311 family)